jgi:hypothetical protein
MSIAVARVLDRDLIRVVGQRDAVDAHERVGEGEDRHGLLSFLWGGLLDPFDMPALDQLGFVADRQRSRRTRSPGSVSWTTLPPITR